MVEQPKVPALLMTMVMTWLCFVGATAACCVLAVPPFSQGSTIRRFQRASTSVLSGNNQNSKGKP